MNEIVLMVVFSGLTVVLISVFFIRYEKKEKQRQGKIFIGMTKKRKMNVIYYYISRSLILKNQADKISESYITLYPDQEIKVYEKTVYTVLGLCLIDFFIFIFIFLLNPSSLSFVLAVFYVYVAQNSIIFGLSRRIEVKILMQLDDILSNIKHHYLDTKDITQALWESVESEKREIKSHIEQIFYILYSSDIDMKMSEYNEACKSRFLRLLLQICVRTAEYGDSFNHLGESVLTTNINIMKKDIRKEIEKIRRMNFIFSGLVFVAVIPLITLIPIRNWAVYNLPTLAVFYYGKKGLYTVLGSFIITVAVFKMLRELKDIKEPYMTRYIILNYIASIRIVRLILKRKLNQNQYKTEKQRDILKRLGFSYGPEILLLKRILYACLGFLVGVVLIIFANHSERAVILTSTYDLYDNIPYNGQRMLTEEELAAFMMTYKDKSIEELTDALRFHGVTNEPVLEQIVALVEEKYVQYSNTYTKWQEILILLFTSVLFYYCPYLILIFKNLFLEDYMSEEVMNFRTILSMQIHLKGIHLIHLLESMEMFSGVFQSAIQNCLNKILCDEEKALVELKESTAYPPFVRLIDCFLLCDRMDMNEAFDEIIEDIRHFQDVYSLELDIMVKRKSDIAELLAFLPGIFILFFYLIIPFIIAGMSMFELSFEGNLGNTIF